MKIKKLLIFLLFATGLQSCYYHNEEELYPEEKSDCDLKNISFSKTVSTILSSTCYSCHSNENGDLYGNGIKLENYTDVKKEIDDGKLLGSIRHDDGFIPMPLGADKMEECNIMQIEAWINAGTPNN